MFCFLTYLVMGLLTETYLHFHVSLADRAGTYSVVGWTTTRTVTVDADRGLTCSCDVFRRECCVCHHMFTVLKSMLSFSFEMDSRDRITSMLVVFLMKTRWWRTRFDNFPARAGDAVVVPVYARFQEYKDKKEVAANLAALAEAAASSEAAASFDRATRSSRPGAVKRAAAMRFGTTVLPGLIGSSSV